jgi:flagellar motor protein MotB
MEPEGREAMSVSRLVLLTVVTGVSLFSTGCVPYEKYRDTVSKLDRAKAHNADLIKKYNQLMAKYMAKTGSPELSSKEREDLLAQIAQLKNELNQTPKFRPEDAPKDTQLEDGGIALGEALLFAPGSARLKPEAAPTLNQIVDLLQSQYSAERFIIEGHTDNQPLNSTAKIWKYNMTLAYNRALAVFQYLLDHGIGEERMVVYSFSFNKPVNPEAVNTTTGRRENRRVVVRRSGERVEGLSTASNY